MYNILWCRRICDSSPNLPLVKIHAFYMLCLVNLL